MHIRGIPLVCDKQKTYKRLQEPSFMFFVYLVGWLVFCFLCLFGWFGFLRQMQFSNKPNFNFPFKKKEGGMATDDFSPKTIAFPIKLLNGSQNIQKFRRHSNIAGFPKSHCLIVISIFTLFLHKTAFWFWYDLTGHQWDKCGIYQAVLLNTVLEKHIICWIENHCIWWPVNFLLN